MQSSMFRIVVILSFLFVVTQAFMDLSMNKECKRDLECASGCCFLRKYCAESYKCPCSRSHNPCKDDEICLPVDIECFVDPCPSPAAHCVSKSQLSKN